MRNSTRTAIRIGPADHGKRMSLADFEHAEVQEGHLYELGRGIIVVSDVPGLRHLALVDTIRQMLAEYRALHREQIYRIAAGNECKILLQDLESERHPDVTIYKTRPPDEEDYWAAWVPEIAVEAISPGSEKRDYVEKREEYLAFGVREYWIVDADRREILVLRRQAGKWKQRVLRPSEIYKTRLLPGFEFDCGKVFEAAP